MYPKKQVVSIAHVRRFALVVALMACSGGRHLASASTADAAPDPHSTDGVESGGAGEAAVPVAPVPPTRYRSYVILGDSVSDRGGGGPFFYDVLGDDLKRRFGEVAIVKGSRGGALSSELVRQVSALPTSLPGPVAVSVTIGGNDMLTAIEQLPNGTDGPARTAFGTNLVAAYDELTRAGRFGAGVNVTIFHATIYDPSDGEGNFAQFGCPSPLASFPKRSTKAAWKAWNDEAKTRLAKYGDRVNVVDVYAAFFGHGLSKLSSGTSWYVSDCIHPSTTGHAELKKLFFASIVP